MFDRRHAWVEARVVVAGAAATQRIVELAVRPRECCSSREAWAPWMAWCNVAAFDSAVSRAAAPTTSHAVDERPLTE